jgi:hypothetical protein
VGDKVEARSGTDPSKWYPGVVVRLLPETAETPPRMAVELDEYEVPFPFAVDVDSDGWRWPQGTEEVAPGSRPAWMVADEEATARCRMAVSAYLRGCDGQWEDFGETEDYPEVVAEFHDLADAAFAAAVDTAGELQLSSELLRKALLRFMKASAMHELTGRPGPVPEALGKTHTAKRCMELFNTQAMGLFRLWRPEPVDCGPYQLRAWTMLSRAGRSDRFSAAVIEAVRAFETGAQPAGGSAFNFVQTIKEALGSALDFRSSWYEDTKHLQVGPGKREPGTPS